MAQQADPQDQGVVSSHRVSGRTRSASLLELAGTGARLVPKQLNDNVKLLTGDLKSKGVKVGVGVGLVLTGLLFLSITFIALVVAMIAGFASATAVWKSALWISLAAFVVCAILAGIGGAVIGAAAPFVPKDLIRGIKHDLGYLREGNRFDPVEFDRLEAEKKQRERVEKAREAELAKQAKKEHKAAVRRGEATDGLPSAKTTEAELRHRMELRRRHLGDIRSGMDEKSDLGAQFRTFANYASGKGSAADRQADTVPTAPYSSAARAGQQVHETTEFVKDRWQPFALLGTSLTAVSLIARRLAKKSK